MGALMTFSEVINLNAAPESDSDLTIGHLAHVVGKPADAFFQIP